VVLSGAGTRETVRELYATYEKRDFDRFAALLHDDIDWVIYGPVQVFSFAGRRRGRAAVLEALAGIAEAYALESYKPEVMIVDGDRAAVLSDARFTQRATHRTLRFRVANFLRIEDGRLIEFREFADSFDQVEQALGHAVEL
jgi:ketosteroid isomerase-like protein